MTSPSKLAGISAEIHDEWFDLDALEHDPERAELRLPIYFGGWKKRWFGWSSRAPQDPLPAPDGTLVVRRVIGFSIEDDAEVGRYPVSHLAHHPEAGELRIVSNIPCEIVVRCEDVDVEFRRT